MSERPHKLRDFLDRFVPDEILDGGYDAARKGRLLVLFTLLITANGPFYVLVSLALRMPGSAWGLGIASPFGAITFLLLRRTKSLAIAGNWLVGVLAGAVIWVTAMSGGLDSAMPAWYVLPGLIALLLVSKRSAVVWTAGMIAVTVGFWAWHLSGVPLPVELPPELAMSGAFSVFTGSCLLTVTMGWLFENAKEAMLAKVDKAREDAEAAHQEARMILNTIDEGLFMVDAEGQLISEPSAATRQWFPEIQMGSTLWSMFEQVDADAACWLEIGWDELKEDMLPRDLLIEQLPAGLDRGDVHLAVEYEPLGEEAQGHGSYLIVVRDISEAVAAEKAKRKERELVNVLGWVMRDRGAVLGFVDEATKLVESISATLVESSKLMRDLHTLKGNSGLFGATRIAAQCHELENKVAAGQEITPEDRQALAADWHELRETLSPLLGLDRGGHLEVEKQEFAQVLRLTRQGKPHREIAQALESWTYEPTALPLGRLQMQAKRLAERLGKGGLTVVVDDGGLSLSPEPWQPFWSNLIHVIRNALDHGIEPPEERGAKSEGGQLQLRTFVEANRFIVEVEDDGRGVAWNKVRDKAASAGLPHETEAELVAALFSPGLSTASEVSEISGRGVGTSAVFEATIEMGGEVTIRSRSGEGTCFRFAFPREQMTREVELAAA